MSKTRSSLSLAPAILGLSLALGACNGDEETPKLFDEEGVWSVIRYDIEGSGDLKDIDTMNRRDAFMLSFDSAERIGDGIAYDEEDLCLRFAAAAQPSGRVYL